MYSGARTLPGAGVSLRLAEHGDSAGIPVVMIHGWPDTASLWRNQVGPLVEAGHRVLAPDMRGRGGSESPAEVDDYRVSKSIADVLAVLDGVGVDRAHVVAHDWGAAVGWALAMSNPHRVRSLVALSVGHPSGFSISNLEQMMRFWYMLLFQFEGIAEELLSRDGWSLFRRFVGNHPDTDRWVEDLSRPGALQSSLNWYRANAHPRNYLAPRTPLPKVQVPVLGCWSTGDFALTERQMESSGEFVGADWRYERIEDSSHWIPLDRPDHFNRLLLDWLAAH